MVWNVMKKTHLFFEINATKILDFDWEETVLNED